MKKKKRKKRKKKKKKKKKEKKEKKEKKRHFIALTADFPLFSTPPHNSMILDIKFLLYF